MPLKLILLIFALIILWVSYIDVTISKFKKEDKSNIEIIHSIIVLEKAMKKLNEALRFERWSLSYYKDRLRKLESRIDILESGHPDSDFDYATTDDDGNAIEIWFDGKRYIPEDKRDEDPIVIYADNKVITETTKPDVRCCARCKYYRPGPDHTCVIRPWLKVSAKEAKYSIIACNDYEEAIIQFMDTSIH